MTSAPELTTVRAVLRPVRESDVPQLHALWTSPGVRRFLWDDRIVDIDTVRDTVERSRALFASRRFGLWGMWLAELDASGARTAVGSRRLAGFGGLWPFRHPPEYELLYGVADELRGRNYAPEIAKAIVDYGFAALDLDEVRASTDALNAASIRVLEKLGFEFVRRSIADGRDTVFYALTRAAAAT